MTRLPQQELPPLRHQQIRAMLVREASSGSLNHSPARSFGKRLAVPAAALALVAAVTGVGLGVHFMDAPAKPAVSEGRNTINALSPVTESLSYGKVGHLLA